ncbi:MAG TPA: lysylphosphatidylglycerol synthase transmembrane domain-containing protein [Burkholderiales bacterium]|nr:lysylphosphatidylglycerol synthase transmembrane domain-containing protein [Burkholderiales bacterium]
MFFFRTPLSAIVVRRIKFLVRLLVSLSILLVILRSIDVGQAWQVIARARPEWLLCAWLMQFGSTAVSAYRWQLIMRNLGFGQTFSFYWDSYFKGMFFNQGLPTSIGGDAIKVLDVARRGFRKRDALVGVAIDRVTGLGALLLLTLAAHLVNPDLLPEQVYRPILWLLVAGLLGFFSLVFLGRLAWIGGNPRLAVVKTMSDRLWQAVSLRRLLLLTSSLLVPLLALLAFFAAGRALGLRYDLVTYFAIVPPALVLTVIPVSIAGWGVREGALVGLFSLIGADKTVVLMMSLVYGILLILVSLPGLAVFLRGRRLWADQA